MNAVETDLQEKLVQMRREFHLHPELSGRESETADRVCHCLDRLGITYRTGIAGHGVVAEIPGRTSGPYVALRADMDALPIHEETGLPFASTRDGVMHACGHDGHMSILLGAAEILLQGEIPASPVRLVFQPSEEKGLGALQMVDAGVLDNVAMIFGGHLDRHYETGQIVVHTGAVNASADAFYIDITGQGGHGARPHESIDAVVIGSLMVMAIQTLVSREVDPAFPSVVSVGRFDAGTATNVIAGQARLEGTIRAQQTDVREHLRDGVIRIATSVAELHGAKVDTQIRDGTPPLINSPEMADLARRAAERVVDPDSVVGLRVANMGGEDFSYYLQHVTGCYVRYGSQKHGTEGFPAHSSRFDFDEATLGIAAVYLAEVARLGASQIASSQPKG